MTDYAALARDLREVLRLRGEVGTFPYERPIAKAIADNASLGFIDAHAHALLALAEGAAKNKDRTEAFYARMPKEPQS